MPHRRYSHGCCDRRAHLQAFAAEHQITIEAWCAGGGGTEPGLGARMKGDFNLVAGEILQILVGQKPTQSGFNGGGGGTL